MSAATEPVAVRPTAGRRDGTQTRRDVYQSVTDRIIAALDAGVVPWRRPWGTPRAGDDGRPRSVDGRSYRGVNVWILSVTAAMAGYGDDPRWGTYKAIRRHGGQVRKGEK